MIPIENDNLRETLKSIKRKLISEGFLIIIIIILKTHLWIYPSKFFIFSIKTFKVCPAVFTRYIQHLHGPALTRNFSANNIKLEVIFCKCFNKSINGIGYLTTSFIMRIAIKNNKKFFDLKSLLVALKNFAIV